ncbi:MAG: ATP-binding protein, partial [bacterium]|nr:ATP-binding protein [bacterium]
MKLRELIGEASDYDKKEALEIKRPKSWCKSVSAFANSFGGKLLFGIANDDTVVGLADAEGDADRISEAVKVHLNPIPEFYLSFESIDDKKIVIVDVRAGNQTPYYYQGEGQLVAFVRIGNESVSASPSQLNELVIRGSGQTYDSLRSAYRFEDMAFTKLRSVYRQQTGRSFEDTDFASFGIIDSQGKLTNAGALLADECPLRHSRLFCTRWNGLTKASGRMEAWDDSEYSGSLLHLLRSGLDFIAKNSKKAWKKTDTERREYPDYPERAYMEGLVNALIHRSYNELGSEVHIDIFDDRLEIYSPGGMVDGSTLLDKDLLSIPSKRRNPVIADIFSRLNYMERRGSGFKKIFEAYKALPDSGTSFSLVFKAEPGDFLLVLPNVNYAWQKAESGNQSGISADDRWDNHGDNRWDDKDKADGRLDSRLDSELGDRLGDRSDDDRGL